MNTMFNNTTAWQTKLFCSFSHAPSSLQIIRLSSDLANPLSGSQY
jgi:hypothetical protein